MRAFRVAYDGRPFHGFQRQPNVPTVEGAIFDALRALDLLDDDEPKPAGYAAAGRTDAGVSAVAQTVGFTCPDWLTPSALNAELPADVRAWAAADVDPDFSARYDADRRTYVYHLFAPGASVDLARTVCSAIVGTHDFRNLTADREGTTRTIDEATVERDGDFLVLRVTARAFLHQQVRRIASLVRAVAAGERPAAFVDRVLSAETLDGPDGIAPAPAPALVLVDVTYPDVTFTSDPDAASRSKVIFERRRIEHRTNARVAGELVDRIP